MLQENLSDREHQILHLLNDGKTFREIGASLFISEASARKETFKLYKKHSVNNSRQLLKLARESNFFTPENQENGR